LTEIANSVRRNDPVTGQKINKLRSSYKGKLKELKVAGKNEAPSHPGLWVPNMMIVPEDDWVSTFVRGKMPDTVTAASDWSSKLKRALEMAPGKLPPQLEARYSNFTNLEDPVAAKMRPPTALDPAKKAALAVHAHTTPPSPAKGGHRPARSSAKRSYDDSSFAGYGDGFVDDEDGTDIDGRLGHKKKKLRKVNQTILYSLDIIDFILQDYSAATSPSAGPSNSYNSHGGYSSSR
jgi:hypothetical protein